MATGYTEAPADGYYRSGRGQFKVKQGGRMPAKAEFVPSASISTPDTGPVVQTEGHKKWYLEYVEKVGGENAIPVYEGETQAAFLARIGDETRGGDETT